MQLLKEKLEETKRQHKLELRNNLINKAIHIGNLKNIKAGDLVPLYYGNFYTTTRLFEVQMLSKNALYIYMHFSIYRFHAYNCREWTIDKKPSKKKGTTDKENWQLADNNFINLIKYPIINVKYKESMPITEDFLCYNTKKLTVCPYLNYFNGNYQCKHRKHILFDSDTFTWNKLNGQNCRKEISNKPL